MIKKNNVANIFNTHDSRCDVLLAGFAGTTSVCQTPIGARVQQCNARLVIIHVYYLNRGDE